MSSRFQRILKYSFLILTGLLLLVAAAAAHYYYKGFYRGHRLPAIRRNVSVKESTRLTQKAAAIRNMQKFSRYNQRVVLLVDMSLPSGKNRFFVYDLQKDSIRMEGLVAHGCGEKAFSLEPVFSNIEGSNCSALGRYRIGGAYTGQFGRAYLLYGLDSSNNRALERHIVLHSYTAVPESETAPYPICNSRGCPMVSPGFLSRLQPLIDHSDRPLLLWIFR